MSARTGTVYAPYCADTDEYTKQKFLFTTLCVAGKKATIQQQKVDICCNNLTRWCGGKLKPLLCLLAEIPEQKRAVAIERELKAVKLGQYKRLTSALLHLCSRVAEDANYLNRVTREQLTECPGVSMKTASFFLLNTRKNYVCAILDTHTLRWLQSRGHLNAPSSSPQDAASYFLWETVFLGELLKEGKTAADIATFDLAIWKAGAGIL